MIKEFISSRTNLTILQCVCYLMILYIMGEYLNWIKFSIMFGVIILLQFITRTKGVADGMVFRQVMLDNEWKVNDLIEKIKQETKKTKKNNDIN